MIFLAKGAACKPFLGASMECIWEIVQCSYRALVEKLGLMGAEIVQHKHVPQQIHIKSKAWVRKTGRLVSQPDLADIKSQSTNTKPPKGDIPSLTLDLGHGLF